MMMSNFVGPRILHLSQATYSITKSVNGSFASTKTSTTTNHLDDEYLNDVVSCYKISYADACNNKSPVSVEACPIKLIATLQPIIRSRSAGVRYAGWKNGVNRYVVEKFNEQGQLLFHL
jgi:hypothetical protein